MHGRGACVAGHAWQGVCMAWDMCGMDTTPPPILRDTVNEQVVRILLECILVQKMFTISGDYFSDTNFFTPKLF